MDRHARRILVRRRGPQADSHPVAQRLIRPDVEHIATFDPTTVLALIAKLREAERERDEARWAAGIVGDVARESSGGWQDAAAELHATQARLREAEAVIEKELLRHREKHGETPRFAPDDYQHELAPTHWEPYVICDACGTFWPCKTTQTLVYKPTNQENGEET